MIEHLRRVVEKGGGKAVAIGLTQHAVLWSDEQIVCPHLKPGVLGGGRVAGDLRSR